MNGYPVGEVVHPAVVIEIFCPGIALQQGKYLRGYPPRQGEAAGGHKFQNKAGGFGRQVTDEQLHRFGTDKVLVMEGSLADDGCGIAVLHPLRQPFGYLLIATVHQEMVDIFDTHTGYDAFPAYMTELPLQVIENMDVSSIAGSEIAVTALCGKGVIKFS